MLRVSVILLTLFLVQACATKYLKKNIPKQDPCQISRTDTANPVTQLGLNSSQLNEKTGVYSLENGGESFITRLWLFENAKKTLDIQYYMFLYDRTGLISADYLLRAADRGVKIRILLDDATAKKGSKEIYALDAHPGIEIKVYSPGVKLGSVSIRMKTLFTKPWRLNRRMHNKTVTVDGQISLTGGRNIADEYFDYDHRYNFRDRDVLLLGKACNSVTKSFNDFWESELSVPYLTLVKKYKRRVRNPNYFNRIHEYACDEKNLSNAVKSQVNTFPSFFKSEEKKGKVSWASQLSFVSDVPGKNEKRKNREGGICKDSLYAVLKHAKKSVDIQSSYLILNDEQKKLLTDLVSRGVKVRVLTNSLESIDNIEAFSGFKRDREKILQTGIEVYEFKPHAPVRQELMIPEVQAPLSYTPVYGHHAKTMVIDNQVTIIGSFNIDPRSANLNTECITIIRSPEVSKNVMEYMEKEFSEENSWHVTKEFNPDKKAPLKKKFELALRRVFPKESL